MGLFDFLNGDPQVSPGAQFEGKVAPNPEMNGAFANGLADRMGDPGMLQKAPTLSQGPGFLEKLRTPDDRGLTFGDKLYAAGSALSDDGDAGVQHLQNVRKDFKADQVLSLAKEDRARKNAAFKAAYQNGKFDPAAYTSALGDSSVDPSDIAELTRAFSPKAGVDGGYSYTQDPTTGETHWGGQRPESYGEQAAIAREAEQERRNQQLEDIARQGLKIREFSAHRPRAGHASSASGLPPGYVAR